MRGIMRALAGRARRWLRRGLSPRRRRRRRRRWALPPARSGPMGQHTSEFSRMPPSAAIVRVTCTGPAILSAFFAAYHRRLITDVAIFLFFFLFVLFFAKTRDYRAAISQPNEAIEREANGNYYTVSLRHIRNVEKRVAQHHVRFHRAVDEFSPPVFQSWKTNEPRHAGRE